MRCVITDMWSRATRVMIKLICGGLIVSCAGLVVAEELVGIEVVRKLAENGDSAAQVVLGEYYEFGDDQLGVARNLEQAFALYAAAAKSGNTSAQFRLGVLYDLGRGVPENDAVAARWYKKAAEKGRFHAQYNLGLLYANGEGITRDYKAAYVWWSLAKTQGYDEAGSQLERLIPLMESQQLAEAQAIAGKCWESDYKDCD